MLDSNIHDDINTLKSISQNVRQYIDNTLFLGDVEETVPTPTDILLNCYYFILEDLRDLGITPLNPDDFLSNFYSARVLMKLRDILSAESLFRDCSASEEYTSTLLGFLETDDNFINELIEYLHSHNPAEYALLMYEGMNRFQVDEKLSSHIQSVAAIITSGTESVEYDEQEYLSYTQSIYDHVQEIRSIFTRVSSSIRADKEKVLNLINRHDNDKLDPEVSSVYIKKALYGDNPLFKSIYKGIHDAHHRNNEHHIEFWRDRPGEMRPEHLTEMIIDTSTDFTGHKLSDERQEGMSDPYESFIDRFLDYREVYDFTDDQWEYIVHLGKKIFVGES